MSTERDALEQELLELYFDCHPDPDSLRRRLAEEPELRALYDRVCADAELLERAAHTDASTFEPEERPRSPWLLGAPIGLAAAACVLALGHWAWCSWSHGRLERDTVRLVVLARGPVPDAAPLSFDVDARDARGEPTDCRVEYVFALEDGTPIAVGELQGHGVITQPAVLPAPRSLELVAHTPRGERRLAIPLRPTDAAPLVHLETDKPVYRPGETVLYRAVLLDRVSLEPAERDRAIDLRVRDARDAVVTSIRARPRESERGVVAGSWQIPNDAPGGTMTLELHDPSGRVPPFAESFLVRRFEPPRLEKVLVLDRESYAPGDAGSAEVSARRLAGDAAAGATVGAWVVIDGERVWSGESPLDTSGRARFAFTIPESVERGEARFFARVTDGGTIETAIEPFVVPTGELTVRAYPEGGDLVAGLPGRVYIELTDSLGRPASGAGRIVDDGGAEVARFRTEHAGRARLTFTPRGGVRYACVLDDGTEAELPAVKRDGVVLASLADAHPAASPVALRIRTTRDERHTVAVFCRGVCVASAVTEGAGVHDVALAVPEEVFGVLRVTVFDAEMRPRAERLVQRLPAQRLAVELSPRHATRAPGERQAIAVTTTDERGRPRSAAIGLVVTDHAVRALAGEPRIGLLDRTALLGDVAVPEDLADFLLETEGAPARVDLLLGTLGWRRFVWVPGSDELASADVTRARALEGAGSVVIEHSTARDDTAEIDAAARATRRAKEIALVTLMLSAIAMLVLGATLGAAWLARRLEWSGTPRGKLLVAGPILAAGIVVLSMLAAPGAIGSRFAAGDAMEAAPLDRVGIAGAWRDAPRFGGAELADAFRFFAFAPVDEAAAQPEAEELEGNLRAGGGLAVDLYVTHDTVVREYAHRHHGAEGRSDFTETVYWNALLVTDESGRTEIEFDLSDRVTTWDVEASAHGAGRVGQGRARFDTRLPFFLEAKLPVELTAGDRVDVPVALVAEGGGPAEAEVRARAAGAVRTDGGEHQRVVLEAGRGRALVPLVAGEPTESPTRIDVVAAAGRFRDAVRKDVRVVPRGFPHRRSWAGTLGAEASELVVAMPVRGGTPSLVLKVFPSPLSTLREGLDGILGEPHGCFEQASSSNYPNTLVLSYLEASGDVVPEVSARARELLPRGYELITSYECRERGYEWFGGDPGHEALTAYGLVQFEDMRRVFDVDADMLARTRAWLLARRDGSGSFARNPRALDRFGSAPAETTDAYVVFALLYAGEPAAELAAELARLEERATSTDDAYELAVAACAFTRAERAESARAACARLASMQREDGALAGKASITRSGERDLVVETTSFAVLAWLAHGDEHLARARKACEFLQTQQSARGTFGATQATIMALKALTELARSRRTLPTHGSIRVFRGDELLAERAFASSDPDAIELELARTLGPGEHRLSLVLEADGEAHLPWACDLAYHADRPADDPEAVIAIDTSIDAAEVTEGDSVAVRVRVRNTTPDGQPMTVANVGLPAALEAPVEVLDAQRDAGAYDLWEIRGRTLTFYWRALEPSAERAFVIDCVARLPGATTGPASSAYLYYTPDARRWAAPMSVITR